MEDKVSIRLAVRLFKDEKAFGPGIAALLRNVERFGSLQKAADSMDMAYSKAWKTVKDMEKVWGFSLTYRDIGGKNGGGSTLTPEARLLLERYDSLTEDINRKAQQTLDECFSESFFKELDELKSTSRKEDD